PTITPPSPPTRFSGVSGGMFFFFTTRPTFSAPPHRWGGGHFSAVRPLLSIAATPDTDAASCRHGDDAPPPRRPRREAPERARRTGRSKQDLAIEAIREAEARAELNVHDVLAELTYTDSEILDHLK
ncbi:hypothetical protein, partial [Streptomyces koyangensis]|uniref:hypothetical protein n=1 Tax=Streptomyces koyangensis TaxID=188770 RepID=UPI003BF61B77